jgi:hypothetical protein
MEQQNIREQHNMLSARLATHAAILEAVLRDKEARLTRTMMRSLLEDLREDTSTAIRLEKSQ